MQKCPRRISEISQLSQRPFEVAFEFYTTQTTNSENLELAGSTGGILVCSQKPTKLERNLPEI